MNWINNRLINKAQIARLMKISRTGLKFKIEKTNGNFFNESDKNKLNIIAIDLMKELIGHNEKLKELYKKD